MRNTYWFAVDYNGTGHLFTCPPERDTGMWTGEEALYIPKGQFGEMFPRITWQDAPVVVTLEVLPCVETRRLIFGDFGGSGRFTSCFLPNIAL